MCGLLGVSPSGHYAWLYRIPSVRELADRAVWDRITDIYSRSRGAYGGPRIHAELATEGVSVGRKRVARLMRQARIHGGSCRRSRSGRNRRCERHWLNDGAMVPRPRGDVPGTPAVVYSGSALTWRPLAPSTY